MQNASRLTFFDETVAIVAHYNSECQVQFVEAGIADHNLSAEDVPSLTRNVVEAYLTPEQMQIPEENRDRPFEPLPLRQADQQESTPRFHLSQHDLLQSPQDHLTETCTNVDDDVNIMAGTRALADTTSTWSSPLTYLDPLPNSVQSVQVSTIPTSPGLVNWPLESREEAKLMQHFVQNVAPCLDLTDPMRHFASVVPIRAQSSSLLRDAIFAASARHLSRTESMDPFISDR